MLIIMLDSLVFFGMALGYLGGWTRDVDNKHVAELNALVMDFAVPASMFVTVVQASRRTLLDELPLLAAALAWLYAISPLTAREAIVLSALPVGFFGVLFGLRFNVSSEL